MRAISFVAAFLAYVCHGRRLHMPGEQTVGSSYAGRLKSWRTSPTAHGTEGRPLEKHKISSASDALNPAAGWQTAGHRPGIHARRPVSHKPVIGLKLQAEEAIGPELKVSDEQVMVEKEKEVVVEPDPVVKEAMAEEADKAVQESGDEASTSDWASNYTAPGALARIVAGKELEIKRLEKMPEAREDGTWMMRLQYLSSNDRDGLTRAIGWRRERPIILADIKRTSPTGVDGETEEINPNLQVEQQLVDFIELGCEAALVCTDTDSYGGTYRDLKAAVSAARARLPEDSEDDYSKMFPIVSKDFIIDPLQIARAACEGAGAVLLIASACLPDLEDLLDTCTIVGLDAIVEVHTPDEINVATEAGACTFLINERNRATGKIVEGLAEELSPMIAPYAQRLVCGGINSIDRIRKLREFGYDGFVIGRAFAKSLDAYALMKAIKSEPDMSEISRRVI